MRKRIRKTGGSERSILHVLKGGEELKDYTYTWRKEIRGCEGSVKVFLISWPLPLSFSPPFHTLTLTLLPLSHSSFYYY